MKTKTIKKNKYEFVPEKGDEMYSYGGSMYSGAYATADLKGNKLTQNDYFFTCREEFADYFHDRRNYLLMKLGNAKEISKVQKFMKEIERRLKLGARSKLKIEPIGEKNIILISNLKWWKANEVRRQFLTAALRHGRYYTGDFEKALDAADYFNHTKRAVNKFLSGFTNFDNKTRNRFGSRAYFSGWVGTFYEEGDDPVLHLVK